MSTSEPATETLRLIARVLTLHFQEGMLQAEIASALRLSTAKVNRLIKQGRELGMVEFKIHSPFQRLFELERQMKARWPLAECLVVDTVTDNAETTLDLVGKATAQHLANLLDDDSVLAISGGKTLSAVANHLNARAQTSNVVVPMTGGVQGQHYTDVNHIATRIADGLGGTATLIHAPLHTDTQQERDMVLSVRSVRDVLDQARRADVSLLGLGAVAGESATYYTAHPISSADREQLYNDGVRAELLGHLVDARGALCDSDLNSRLVSLPLQDALNIPVRIGVATGADKVEPACAALNGGHISTLVVDDTTAQAVLDYSQAEQILSRAS
ncbi:sugar-binding transcriptional regulator [Shimia abyssi]|uniref:DNA-binding transcriptional regulator LsrR (DeoR family) n=1 Tax=Shimia abyssi TaxID=1662395 RepID=A0A2P8F7X3_9RHOB|nr:sugar-binding transcriptional regulator [Shimia abyssi]PSL17820.1 DNA-binding transcriptional regulator LsrR (DeoR family) [Shimia abyssi]